jgi:peptidoglycan hydrolase-like protein with peptidoglycan-binding domain
MPFILDYKRADRVPTVQVQEALISKGYTPGPADGRFGVQTMRAVVKFQTDHHLHPSGAVDETLYTQIIAAPKPAAPKPKPKTKTTPKAEAKPPAAKSGSSTPSGETAKKGMKQ